MLTCSTHRVPCGSSCCRAEGSIVTIDGQMLSQQVARKWDAGHLEDACALVNKVWKVVSLSSAESEYYSMARCACEAIGLATTVRELGHEAHVRIWTDAAAARGLPLHSGSGTIKHVEPKYFGDQKDQWHSQRRLGRPVSLLDQVHLGSTQRTGRVSTGSVMDNQQNFSIWLARIQMWTRRTKIAQDITLSYDMEGHAQKCVERYCEWAYKTVDPFHKVSTFFLRSRNNTRRFGHGGRIVRDLLSDYIEIHCFWQVTRDNPWHGGTEHATCDEHVSLVTFITHPTTDSVVTLGTKQQTAIWGLFQDADRLKVNFR